MSIGGAPCAASARRILSNERNPRDRHAAADHVASSRRHAPKGNEMVTRNDLFPPRFINAASLESPTVVTIAFAKIERLENMKGESEDKLVVYFEDHKQHLACNATNFDSICEITNQFDSENWGGHKVELYRDTTRVGGKTVPCVRVRAPSGNKAPASKPPSSSKPKKVIA
jgi:hypothetical protein